jgi:hypothetical protein
VLAKRGYKKARENRGENLSTDNFRGSMAEGYRRDDRDSVLDGDDLLHH